MLGLILLYFLGKSFYTLAEKHNKNRWGYAVLGVFSYYFGTFLGGIAVALAYELFEFGSINDLDDTILNLMALPFGILLCWLFYTFLKNRFRAKPESSDPDILDDEFILPGSQNSK